MRRGTASPAHFHFSLSPAFLRHIEASAASPYNAYSRRIYSFNFLLLIAFELKINEKLQRANATTTDRACYK